MWLMHMRAIVLMYMHAVMWMMHMCAIVRVYMRAIVMMHMCTVAMTTATAV
jgi:hypothetical protein